MTHSTLFRQTVSATKKVVSETDLSPVPEGSRDLQGSLTFQAFLSVPSLGKVIPFMLKWLVLDLNSYFASCEQQLDSKLRGRPVAVVPFHADTTAVLAASYEAKAFGVKTGVKVGDAKRMCPGLICVEADHEKYTRFHHQIVDAVETCAPIAKVLSIDEVAVELTGTQRQLDVAIELALSMKKAIARDVGEFLKCSIGISSNLLLAKLGSDLQKPDGLTVLPPERIPASIIDCKLRELSGIGRAMEARLNACGVFTMEQLYARTVDQMREIWGGVVGERYYHWIRGVDYKLPDSPQKSIGHQHVLEPEVRTYEKAYPFLKKLLIKAAVRVRKEGFFTKRLSISIKFLSEHREESLYFDQFVKFPETQDTLLLLKWLDQVYAKVPREHRPLRVSVTFSDFVQQDFRQYTFEDNPKRESLMKALDRINERYGKSTLLPASIAPLGEKGSTKISFSRIPDLDEF